MKRTFVFPGQGSQFVGMGQDLYEAFPIAKEVFQEIDDTLEQKLSQIIFEGPQDKLTLTENTQPALMAVSMCIVKILEKEGQIDLTKKVTCVAGHSLGEYTALACANSFSLSQTAKLLKIRGQAMQRAVPVGQGAMAALIGLPLEIVEEIATQASNNDEVCVAANDNAPGQIVISGHTPSVQQAIEIAQEHKCRRSVLLPVSAPFHSPLMKPAADEMNDALKEMFPNPPLIPIICNVTAKIAAEPQEIKDNLVHQVTGRVRWRESIEYLNDIEIEEIIEIGAGKVLTGLNKRINKETHSYSIQSVSDVEELIKKLS